MPAKTARKKVAIKLKKNKKSYIKRYKNVALFVCILFISVAFLFTFTLYKEFNKNLTSALTPSKTIFMETGYPTVLNVVVDDLTNNPATIKKLEFKIFDMDGKKVITYDIPTDYELDIPGRLGYEKISNLFLVNALNNSDTKNNLDTGIELLNNSLLPIFGLTAERYTLTDETINQKLSGFWETGDIMTLLDKRFVTSLGTHFRSNFSAKELFKIGEFINSLPADRLILNTHLKSYINDTEIIDQELREMMLLSQISKEGYSIAILNGAGKTGFAAFGARIVANNGGRVIAVNNSDEDIKDSVIISDLQESLTVRKFASILGITNIITKEKALERFSDSELDRADVIVVMGFDLAERL